MVKRKLMQMERKNIYEKKYFNLKALDVDTATRQVKVAIAQMEDIDRDKDVFAKSAFDRTINAKGPKGSNEIWHLLDHTPTSFSALSKFSEVYNDGKYIVGISKYKDSFAWREVAWPLYEGGDFTQHSVGFRTLKSEQRNGYREITEVELWEGSAVLWGAQPDTPTIGVTKSISFIEQRNNLNSRLERLLKFIKTNHDYEETKSLVEIEFKQIQQQIADLENSTQPAEKAPDPESNKATDPMKPMAMCDNCKQMIEMPSENEPMMTCKSCGGQMPNPRRRKARSFTDLTTLLN